jgi:hypothetical protein
VRDGWRRNAEALQSSGGSARIHSGVDQDRLAVARQHVEAARRRGYREDVFGNAAGLEDGKQILAS